MCYAHPGPRCSKHEREALLRAERAAQAALGAGDHDAYFEARAAVDAARDAYDRTPEGIKALRAAGHGDLAAQYERERKASLVALRRRPVTPSVTTRFPALSPEALQKTADAHAARYRAKSVLTGRGTVRPSIAPYADTAERRAVNFLRHACTDYDARPSTGERHAEANALIAVRFPHLREECERQNQARFAKDAYLSQPAGKWVVIAEDDGTQVVERIRAIQVSGSQVPYAVLESGKTRSLACIAVPSASQIENAERQRHAEEEARARKESRARTQRESVASRVVAQVQQGAPVTVATQFGQRYSGTVVSATAEQIVVAYRTKAGEERTKSYKPTPGFLKMLGAA